MTRRDKEILDYLKKNHKGKQKAIHSKDNDGLNGHEAVDLGLPSGTKWATCNVGASTPEEAGYFFAWGEVAVKEDYSWATYKWSVNGSDSNFSKYPKGNNGILEPADDAAHVWWGGSWRMPTSEDAQELLDNCQKVMVTQNDKKGLRLTGPNGNTLFLPASGYYDGKTLTNGVNRGYYWLSDQVKGDTRAYNLAVRWDALQKPQAVDYSRRFAGMNIRAVIKE